MTDRANATGMLLIKHTTSVCSTCLAKVPARVLQDDGRIVMHKTCPLHGEEHALLASDPTFYWKRQDGGSCGPGGCGALFNHSCTLIFEITEKCNLTCPTCFTDSSPHLGWKLSVAEFTDKLDRLLAAGKRDSDIVQISGGEPTVHPDVVEIIDICFDRRIKQVYLNTNGIELGKSPALAQALAKHAGRLQIYLQFDGFRHETYDAIRGAKGILELKLRAIDHCRRADIFVLPVMTVTRGINLDEIGALLRFTMDRFPHLNGVMLQPAMYAGRYLNEQLYDRVTVGELALEVERQTDGLFTRADFGPIPCSDPNCFAMAVGVRIGGKVVPISRYFPAYDTWTQPGVADRIEQFTDRLPSNMLESLADDDMVDQLLDLLTSSDDSLDLSDKKAFFMIAVKPFMDANCYDQDRVDACCVHVVDRQGNPVSLCEYNCIRRPKGLL